MFGALNRFIARLDSDPTGQTASQVPAESSYGFQVLRNTNPQLLLEPWFDFIVGINGHGIDNLDSHLFSAEVRNCAGLTLSLEVWSAKGQRTQSLSIQVPSTTTLTSLGLTLQLAPLSSSHNIWHVLSIPSPLSPAHTAGLLPHSDYIVGTPSGTLHGESAFSELIEDHLNRGLILWVYNSEYDVVREVELVPRRGWGGDGALGAVLGFGALHRLPVGLGEEVHAPGEKMFDAGYDSERASTDAYNNNNEKGTFIVPAEMNISLTAGSEAAEIVPHSAQRNAPPPTASRFAPRSTARQSRKGRHYPTLAPDSAFDDVFTEGLEKSVEQDSVPSKKGTPPAPPPKAGGLLAVTPGHDSVIKEGLGTTQEDVGEPGDAEET